MKSNDNMLFWIFWGAIIIGIIFNQYSSYSAEWIINKKYSNAIAKTDKILAYYPFQKYKINQTLCGRFIFEDKVSGIKSTKVIFIKFYTEVVEIDYEQAQNCVLYGENHNLVFFDGAFLGLNLFFDEVLQIANFYKK